MVFQLKYYDNMELLFSLSSFLSPNQNLSIDTELHAANGKRVKAIDIFAYALAFFKEQALKVKYYQILLHDILHATTKNTFVSYIEYMYY